MKEIYSPNYSPSGRKISFEIHRMPEQRFAKGGLASLAKKVAAAGEKGDTLLIHMNPQEFEIVKSAWGDPEINPNTGLPAYGWFGNLLGNLFSSNTAKSALTNAAIGAGVSALTGGDIGKGALIGGGTGVLGALGSSGSLGPLSGMFSGLNMYGQPSTAPAGASAPAAVPPSSPATGAAAPAGATNPQPAAPGGLPGSLASIAHGVLEGIKKNPLQSALLIAQALKRNPQAGPMQAQGVDNTMSQPLPQLDFKRTRAPLSSPESYYTYGQGPEHGFYGNNQAPVGKADGGGVEGPGTGRSDDIPARLSDGEYVIDAESVNLLGDGSTKAGAAKLDQLRRNLRMHKGKALARGKFSPKAKAPESYLKGGK